MTYLFLIATGQEIQASHRGVSFDPLFPFLICQLPILYLSEFDFSFSAPLISTVSLRKVSLSRGKGAKIQVMHPGTSAVST